MNLNSKIISCSLVDLLKLGYINPLSTDIYSAKNTAEGEAPFFILIVVLGGKGVESLLYPYCIVVQGGRGWSLFFILIGVLV